MKRVLATLVCACPALACADTTSPMAPEDLRPAMAAVAFTSNVSIPVDIPVFIPCAADGAGEVVLLSGRLHLLTHVTIDNRGGFHIKTHAQPQNLTGTGLTTGDSYRGTGVTQDQTSLTAAGTFTFVNNFRIIGQGPGNNLLVHENVHITVNANGEVTATADNFRAECK